jgi:hypothetical protein
MKMHDNRRLQRRLAKLKVDQDRLRQELDEARRQPHGCNKTLLGALVHSILASIMVTCKQQGQRFLELARQLWSAGQPQAIPLVPPPSSATHVGST